MPTLTQSLARLIRLRHVAVEDVRAAERFVRDWLGALGAGGATEAGTLLRAYAAEAHGIEDRVFLAAALSHITETDDLHRASVTHPGCIVIPVALLLGRSLGVSGRQVLTAVLAGYEAMLRIGESLGPAHYRVFHNTATAGVFGAAAAAASLLGLSDDGWQWALGNAGTQAAGLWQFNEDATMSKHLHAGHAAHAGLRAALLARHGFTGPAAILEGERGFFRGYCPDARPERVLADADGWKLHETSLKPYPCCRHTHPAIDAALTVRDRLTHGITTPGARASSSDDILAGRVGDPEASFQHVDVRTYAAALHVTDEPCPETSYAAKFSIQYCVASALLFGTPGLASFDMNAIRDARLRALLPRIAVHLDRELEDAYPGAWGAEVSVTDAAGSTHSRRVRCARGDPESPLDDEELNEKVQGLLHYGRLPDEVVTRLLAECTSMPEGGAVQAIPWLDRK
jgi:2-methylcitrate dehydratase PrpD